MATNNFYVESLDSGFIITHNGKRAAAKDSQEVEKIITSKLQDMFRFHCNGVHSATVSLEFSENHPQQAKK